jgi:hypothetical protein
MAITTYAAPTATYKLSDNIIGLPDLSIVAVASTLGAPGIGQLPSVTVEDYVGTQVKGQSLDATYGGEATFILLAVPTSTTVTAGLLYKYKGDYTIEVVPTAVTTSQSSGQPVALAINSVSSNTTSIQYTWFMVKGRGQALKSVSITAQPSVSLFVSNATAGRVRTTSSAFRAYIGMRSANTSTATGSILPVILNFPNITAGS